MPGDSEIEIRPLYELELHMTEFNPRASLGDTCLADIQRGSEMSSMLLIVEPKGLRRTRTEAEGRALTTAW